MIRSLSVGLVADAVDKFPAKIAILDSEGEIIHVNGSWKRFASENGLVDSKAGEGTDYLAVAEADSAPVAQDAAAGIRRVLSGAMETFEQTYPCHTPEENLWFSLRVAGFQADGERYATVVHADITDRTAREHELEIFESIFGNQVGIALVFDEAGEIMLANERLYEVTGTDPKCVVGTHFSNLDEVLPAETGNLRAIQEMLNQILEGSLKAGSSEVEFFIPEGEGITADVRILPYKIDEYTNGAIFTARDITKWKEREDRLRLFERAVQGTSEMLTAIDQDHSYLFANEAYLEFHELDQKQLLDLTISDVLEGEDLEQAKRHIDRTLEGERIETSQKRMGPGGRYHSLSVRYYPLRGEDGQIKGAVAAMRDMSEQRERKRHIFVMDRVLRHNMNNDMNIIKGNADLVIQRGEGEVAEYGRRIKSTAEGLLTTVQKQRNIIEMLSNSPEFVPLDLVEVVERVVANKQLDHPDAEIRVEAPSSAEIRTISQLEKALSELLENAIFHNEDAEPVVEVRIIEANEAITVEIRDEGPGIPEEELGVLTGEKEIGPLYHGSGMGLWMVNWIVSRSMGSLSFEKASPSGNLVRIELPKKDEEGKR